MNFQGFASQRWRVFVEKVKALVGQDYFIKLVYECWFFFDKNTL
jgi:hypothetical protein